VVEVLRMADGHSLRVCHSGFGGVVGCGADRKL